MKAKKLTLASLKSFIKANDGQIWIKNISDFDAMVDCVMPCNDAGFRKAEKKECTEYSYNHNLGYYGIWLVNGSRNNFSHYNDGIFTGIEVYNCCGSFIVAVKR